MLSFFFLCVSPEFLYLQLFSVLDLVPSLAVASSLALASFMEWCLWGKSEFYYPTSFSLKFHFMITSFHTRRDLLHTVWSEFTMTGLVQVQTNFSISIPLVLKKWSILSALFFECWSWFVHSLIWTFSLRATPRSSLEDAFGLFPHHINLELTTKFSKSNH